LPVGVLAWFELEAPQAVETLGVWTQGDVISRIVVSSASSTATIDYFDLGADILIEPAA
jgi:hypothetical protein